MFKHIIRRIRAAITDWRSIWRTRSWLERIRMLVPLVAGGIVAVISIGVAIWIAMWFFFGPPSVNIAGVMVGLDRTPTLAGVDKDANGIRDDIDEYIKVLAERKAYSKRQVRAIEQSARAIQQMVAVNVIDGNAAMMVSESSTNAINCIFDRVGENDAYAILKQIKKSTINTKLRALAYIKYNHTRDGAVTTFPQKDTCE